VRSELRPGIFEEQQFDVTEETSTTVLGRLPIPVYSTPAMVKHMEGVAACLLSRYLEEGEASVGTKLDVRHLAPTPLGLKVTVRATLIKVEDRRCLFSVEAHDGKERIGEGTHERYVIQLERFLSRLRMKKEQ